MALSFNLVRIPSFLSSLLLNRDEYKRVLVLLSFTRGLCIVLVHPRMLEKALFVHIVLCTKRFVGMTNAFSNSPLQEIIAASCLVMIDRFMFLMFVSMMF